ncbi:MAG: DNA polymerase I [Planctomycetota bacterium]|nr:DNA polymerase I [Planctomycetota bacterium]MDP7245499.1 DNA polymerase I [Planctomycetota bacterium]
MTGKPPRILVVDGTALAFRAFFAIPGLTDSDGRPSGALYGFIMSLLRVLEAEPTEKILVAWDRGEPTFRHKLCKDYKATRERMDDDLRVQLPWMREVIDLLGLSQMDEVGYEADDILASLAVQGADAGYEVRLCASDKDLAQVVSNRVRLCPPPRKNDPIAELGPEEVKSKFGVLPEQMAEWQALVGDSSDNVQGMPGVGPKRATALLEKYGNLESVLSKGPLEEKGKLRENLEAHGDTVRHALQLVTLVRDLDLGPLDAMAPKTRDLLGLRNFCEQHSFDSLAARFETNPLSSADKEHPSDTPSPGDRDYRLVNTPELFDQLINGLQSSQGFAVDTETTSLQARKARLVGISFCWEEETAWYVPLNLEPPLRDSKGRPPIEALAPILANSSIPKTGQNLKYDAHILERAGAPVAGWEFDTMLAHFLADPLSPHNLDALSLRYLGLRKIETSELIGKGKNQTTMDLIPIEDVSRYACEDAQATWLLRAPLEKELASTGSKELFENLEMPLVQVLQKMEAFGIRVDRERLTEMERFLSRRQLELENIIFEISGQPFNLNSPKQLGPILFEKLNIQEAAGVKRVKRTKTGYSTNAATLERYRGIEIVDALLEYRHLSKLRGTYVEALPGHIHPETGCIHTSFHQAVASTGRLSSSDPNLQNIPIRTELGREIRRAFIPREAGWVLVSADYSQVELRVVAHLANDPALIQAFQEGTDVHARTASLVFEIPQDEVTADMRSRAKTINFGILYGMGPQRLARELKIPFQEARDFIEAYFDALCGVRSWLDRTLAEAREKGEVRTLYGRRRPMLELQSGDGRVRASAENVAVNTPVQGTAADIIKRAMLRVDSALSNSKLQARMLLQVHDELVFECPQEEVEPLSTLIKREMEGAADLVIPLRVDIGSGPDWASAH